MYPTSFSDEEDPQEFVERIADRLSPHFNTPLIVSWMPETYFRIRRERNQGLVGQLYDAK
jgi:hypothetical protein